MADLNQTPPEYLAYDRQGHRGTGVFLRLLAGGGTVVSFRENLPYAECVRLGEAFAAFKWVPEPVATYLEVQADLCEIVGEECRKKCSAKGCLCSRATSTCVDSSGNSSNEPGGKQSNRGYENDPRPEIAGIY